MGHTPQRQINLALGGRAWRIDVGASKGVMGGSLEVLEIIHMGGGGGGGGEKNNEEEDVIHVLTASGDRVSGKERSVDVLNDEVGIVDFFNMKQ